MKNFVKNRKKKLISSNRSLLLLNILFYIAFILFLLPLFNQGLARVMHLSGLSYLTTQNIASFLLAPHTLLFLLITIIVIILFFYIKLTLIIHYCHIDDRLNRSNVFLIIVSGIYNAIKQLVKGNFGLLLFTGPFYILNLFSVLICVVFQTSFELSGGRNDELFIQGLITAFLLLISLIAYRGIFTAHYCINENLSFSEAFERSKALLKGRNTKTILRLLLVDLILAVCYFIVYYAVLIITAVIIYLFWDKSIVISLFLSTYQKLGVYSTLVYGMIAFIININVISTMYHNYRAEQKNMEALTGNTIVLPQKYEQVKKHPYLVTFLLIITFSFGLINFFLSLRDDTLFIMEEAFTPIEISSHRGNSHVAPENTIPALENAIVALSDSAEIDVQLTKDGVPVLFHDKTLWRIAGINKYISDMTYEELSQLDVGVWFSPQFADTRIPTLEEAMEYCKGKINLNIEIKVHNNSHELTQKLVELIHKYDYEYQCVVSSSDYNALVMIKRLNDKIKTGYILSGAYGNFYNRENIDFFSIRSGFVTKNVVDGAHEAGKEVHVWTVNAPVEIERMKSIGVDCIITDNPTLAKEIIYRDDTNATIIAFMRQMLRKRSLYRLVNFLNQ